jgi:hypothetical protein
MVVLMRANAMKIAASADYDGRDHDPHAGMVRR